MYSPKMIAALAVILLTVGAQAASVSPWEEFFQSFLNRQKQQQEKLQRSVPDQVEPAEVKWGEDFVRALRQAGKENKLLLLSFSGTTWCQPCIVMDRYVLDTKAFADFAAKNLVLVKVEAASPFALAPSKFYDQNVYLLGKYLGQRVGFPTYLLLDAKGKVLAREAGNFTDTPEGFIHWVQEAQAEAGHGT